MRTAIKKKRLHYGWIVLITGTVGIFSAIGLARFGYTTLLPSMASDLGLDHERTGWLATANLAGYLALAMTGGLLAAKFGVRITAAIGLLLVAFGMFFTGLAQTFGSLLFWRAFTGAGSGMANISIMGLWAAWFSGKKRGFASGIAVAGSSLALVFTGLTIPRIISASGMGAWRQGWFLYSAAGLAIAIVAALFLRNDAGEKNMPLIGESACSLSAPKSTTPKIASVYTIAPVWVLGFIYLAFGFSYIIYTTFFVGFLIEEREFDPIHAGNLFMLTGWISIASSFIWGIISDRIGRKKTLIFLYCINATAFCLFTLPNVSFQTISAVVFGLSAWSIPAIMAASCSDLVGKKLAPAALGFITLLFGIGQALGPVVAGAIADAFGSFVVAFIIASIVSCLGALASGLFIKKADIKS